MVLKREPEPQLGSSFSFPPRTLDPIQSFRLRQLVESASTSKEGRVYSFGRRRNPNAVIFYLVSDWESRHFGVKMAKLGLVRRSVETRVGKPIRVLLGRALTNLESMKVKCIISRNDLTDLYVINELEQMGFIVKDILVTFKKELRNSEDKTIKAEGLDVRRVKDSDIAAICRIAGNSFGFGHFYQDERLDRRRSRMLYVQWARNMCMRSDHSVFVGSLKGRVVGFIACRLETEFPVAVVELASVDPNFRRRGFAGALFQHASDLYTLGAKSLYTGTQATNIASIATFVAAGFKPTYLEATLHRWLS